MNTFRKVLMTYATSRVVVVGFVLTNLVYVYMLVVTIPKTMEYSNEIKLFDMMPTGYSQEYSETLLSTLGKLGRAYYLENQIPIDMVYPLLFGIFYSLLLAFFLLKMDLLKGNWMLLCLLPILAGLSDYGENFGIVSMLAGYPELSLNVLKVSNAFTIVKSASTTVYFVSLISVLIILLVKKIRK